DFDPANPPAEMARLRLVTDTNTATKKRTPAKPKPPRDAAAATGDAAGGGNPAAETAKTAEIPGQPPAPAETQVSGPAEPVAAKTAEIAEIAEATPVAPATAAAEAAEPGLQDVAATAKTVLSGAAIGWLTRPKPERQARQVPWPARILAVVAALASTGSALAISYTETMALGMHAGYSEGMSFLIPLTADGLLMTGIVTAAVRMIRGEKAGFRPFLALIVGGAAAIGANVAARYFGVDTDTPQALWPWIPVVMAAYIPVAALLAAEQGLALIRGGSK
ncbi:MAG: hypothetical protein ACRD0P_27670, partial [Stackebrandtia sp.]